MPNSKMFLLSFPGSEGTLGVVTRVALHCPSKPSSVQVGFLGKLINFSTASAIV